jgi:hypothetical protein
MFFCESVGTTDHGQRRPSLNQIFAAWNANKRLRLFFSKGRTTESWVPSLLPERKKSEYSIRAGKKVAEK